MDLRKPYSFVCFFTFIRMLLVWDVMGEVVWSVANFTALLFFFLRETLKPCALYYIAHLTSSETIWFVRVSYCLTTLNLATHQLGKLMALQHLAKISWNNCG